MEQLQPVQQLQHYEVREIRLGALPSVVLDNGTRYFEGSDLPGGALLLDIQPSHLLVQVGQDTRRVELNGNLPEATKQFVAGSPGPLKSSRATAKAVLASGRGAPSP